MTGAAEEQIKETDFQQELKAMEAVASAIQPLHSDSQKRVLQWAASRFVISGIAIDNSKRGAGAIFKQFELANDSASLEGGQQPKGLYADLASLFDAANPKTNVDKALVVGYWAQECLSNADFAAQQINSDLKNLGHGVGNITDAFNALIAQKLVMQIRKSGTTKQARKKYRLTREGIKAVQQMLNSGNEN